MRITCMQAVYELAKQDPRVVFVGSDIGAGTLDNFKNEMPERFFMEGVSEAHLVGMLTGLALSGKIPYMNTIGTFITRRCFEQVLLDACLHNVNLRLIGSGGGTVYAPLGPTHLALEDIAIMRAIPNMTVVVASDAEEMKRLIPATLHHQGPLYIRLAKGGDNVVSQAQHGFEIGKAILMRSGKDGLYVSTGVTTRLALEAAQALESKGVSVGVLHVHTVKPFDQEALLKAAASVKAVVSIEEHYLTGGLGSAVAEILLESSQTPQHFKRIAFPDRFIHHYGSQDLLMQDAGVTAENAAQTMRRLLTKE